MDVANKMAILKENSTKRIYFNPNILLVKGKTNSALYDLNNRELYSLNSSGTLIAQMVQKRDTISKIFSKLSKIGFSQEDVNEFLNFLLENKLARASYEIKKRRVKARFIPPKADFVWLELTERCNLKCIHCYAECKPLSTQKELSLEAWKTVLNDIRQIRVENVQFIGGEPLAKKGFSEILKHGKKLGFPFIEVFTNGTLTNDTHLHLFKEYGINLAISLYSYRREVHECITGIKGSFNKTVNTIKKARQLGIPVRVGLIIMKQNEDDVDKTYEFLSHLGVKYSKGDPVRNIGRGENPEIHPTKFRREQNVPSFRFSKSSVEQAFYFNPCWKGKLSIDPYGNVIPCIMARENIIGNIKEKSLKDIIKWENIKKFWGLTLDQIEGCKECEYRYACHDCRPIAASCGNLYAKTPHCTYNPFVGQWASILAKV